MIGEHRFGMGKDAARLEANRLNRVSTDETVTHTAEEHKDSRSRSDGTSNSEPGS